MADNPARFWLAVGLVALCLVVSTSESDQEILLKFKDSLQNNGKLSSWNASTLPCGNGVSNWVGVICDTGGSVHSLKLENMGLAGELDIAPLKGLVNIRVISLKKNSLSGSLPGVNQLGALKSVFLSHNNFSGEIADGAFEGMLSLKKVDLGHNGFEGKIPVSLAKLPRLLELRLEDNHFQGQIPSFASKSLAYLNVSNNELEGSIPEALRDLDMASFSGNKNLCGGKLPPCPESAESDESVSEASKATNATRSPPVAEDGQNSYTVSLATGAVIVAIILLITSIVYILKSRPQRAPDSVEAPVPERSSRAKSEAQADQEAGHSMTSISGGKKDQQQTKLTFLKESMERFDLQDLLKASAEILGSGVFGSSYKADMSMNGPAMVVKRYRQMNNMDKEEFQEHMRRLGKLDHPNLLSLIAFYYRKEEKLMISEFVPRGSLASQLHSKHSADKPSLDWPTRLKIVKGVAKGLSVLYRELPSLTTPHGHLKSSNVLLNDSFDPLLTDYGLVPLVNQEHAQKLMIAYKSPEYVHHGRITKKTDVWALGILILETLTGKFPANFLQQGKGEKEFDLALWARNMVDEDNVREVFDKEMKGAENSEGEWLKLLNIGLACSHGKVEARLDLKEAVEKIEEVREKDNEDEFYSTYAPSDGNSKGKSDEFNFS